MSTKTMKVSVLLRRDSAAQWTSLNPVLKSGEIGLETDTSLFKIGDGKSSWSFLSYVTGSLSLAAVKNCIVQGVATITNGHTETLNNWFENSIPFVEVSLPTTQADTNYDVLLDVVSVTNDGFEGRVYSYDRLTNGFKIGYTGTADSVTVHWTVVNGLQQ